jgi:hypothetical protein
MCLIWYLSLLWGEGYCLIEFFHCYAWCNLCVLVHPDIVCVEDFIEILAGGQQYGTSLATQDLRKPYELTENISTHFGTHQTQIGAKEH